MKKLAFTLAEVLISLAVIGVISAMTLPALNSTLTTRQLETGTLKAYNMMQDAISRYMADKEKDSWPIETMTTSKVQSFVNDYFKVMAECDTFDACAPDVTYKDLANNSYIVESDATYVLNNGIILSIFKDSIYIDINGVKGPNILNKDLWNWAIRDNGDIVDLNQTGGVISFEDIEPDFESCRKGEEYFGCFAKFLTNGHKFEY